MLVVSCAVRSNLTKAASVWTGLPEVIRPSSSCRFSKSCWRRKCSHDRAPAT